MSVISKENRKKLASMFDELIKFKNPILETADGWILAMGIGILDDTLLSKIKPEYQPTVDQLAGLIADKEYELAAEVLGQMTASIVDTPLIDGTEQEQELYVNAFKLIAQLIENAIGPKE